MASMRIAGVFPPFRHPDNFERTVTGRYVCRLCPAAGEPPMRPTFVNDKLALEHEKTSDHKFCWSVAKHNPWDKPYNPNPRDWEEPSPAKQKKEKSKMTEEQRKDLEYRDHVQEIPNSVGRWLGGFERNFRTGDMAPVDEPAHIGKRTARKMKEAARAAAAGKTSSSDESAGSSSTSRPSRPNGSSSARKGSTIDPPSIPRPPKFAFIDPSIVRPPKPMPAPTSPPIDITPNLHRWVMSMASEYRLSPLRTRQMRDFLQLPTNVKVNMVERSAWDLRDAMMAC